LSGVYRSADRFLYLYQRHVLQEFSAARVNYR
jgi:hypothetical protein